MLIDSDRNMSLLKSALSEEPALVLRCFSYGWLLQKREGNEVTEYAVAPEQIALALAAKITFDTGLLADDTLLVRQEGVSTTVVEFRRAQKTGIFLEDCESALRVPLPPLILIRKSSNDTNLSYQLYALKARPTSLDAELFHAPLPNVYHGGGICWGSVQLPAPQSNSLAADWERLLGTRFNSHSVSGKSKAHPRDIRAHYIALEQRKARVYPKRDLIAVKKTLWEVL